MNNVEILGNTESNSKKIIFNIKKITKEEKLNAFKEGKAADLAFGEAEKNLAEKTKKKCGRVSKIEGEAKEKKKRVKTEKKVQFFAEKGGSPGGIAGTLNFFKNSSSSLGALGEDVKMQDLTLTSEDTKSNKSGDKTLSQLTKYASSNSVLTQNSRYFDLKNFQVPSFFHDRKSSISGSVNSTSTCSTKISQFLLPADFENKELYLVNYSKNSNFEQNFNNSLEDFNEDMFFNFDQ